jgi:purine catabolism regulator
LPQLVEDLAQAGAAALAFKPGQFIQEIPEEMIEISNRYKLPVIAIPVDTSFIDVANSVMELVLNWQMALLSRAEEIGTKLTNMVLENRGIQALAENVSGILNTAISILDSKGNVIVEAPKNTIPNSTGCIKSDIIVNKKVAGKLIVYKESVDAMEQVCVDQARVVFSLELMRMKTAEQTEIRLKGNFIDELLSELPPSEFEVQKKGGQLGFDPDKLWEIGIIEGINYDSDGPILSELKTLLMNEGQRKGLSPHLERRGTQILLLLPTQEKEDKLWLDILKVWIDQHLGADETRIHIGMGTKGSLWNVYQSYLEARKALEITSKTYAQNCLVSYEDVEVNRIGDFAKGLVEYLKNSYRDILSAITETKDFSKETEERLKQAIEEFKVKFV